MRIPAWSGPSGNALVAGMVRRPGTGARPGRHARLCPDAPRGSRRHGFVTRTGGNVLAWPQTAALASSTVRPHIAREPRRCPTKTPTMLRDAHVKGPDVAENHQAI